MLLEVDWLSKSEDGHVATVGGQWFGLDALDRQLFTQLAEVSGTFGRHSEKIWGLGFRPDLKPLLLVRINESTSGAPYGYAINVGRTELPAESVAVSLPDWLGLRDVYRFEANAIDGLEVSADDPAQFACQLGDYECMAVAYDCNEAHASSWEFTRFLVHEAFHQYQLFEQAWPVPRGYDPAVPWNTDRLDAELATRELWYLEAAVVQASDRDAVDLARSFLAVRSKRHARRPDLIALEQGHEQVEGAARYVENSYAALNGRPLRLPVPNGADTSEAEFASIGRYYRTGARVMELLDRLGPAWRHQLSTGMDPVTVLTSLLAIVEERTCGPEGS